VLDVAKRMESDIARGPTNRALALRIASHVRVCTTGDGSVLLDLRRDRYLGLGREDTELLAITISGWPKPRWEYPRALPNSPTAMSRLDDLCRSMVEGGLLVPGVFGHARDAEDRVDDMRREWISIGDELEVESRITIGHVANFVVAFMSARCSLACRPFWAIVETIRVERRRHMGEVDLAQMQQVAALVGIFRQLRPFVFAAEGRCLLHALTLVKFLSRYDFYPEWVIGVATQPWAAHSWVQWGDFLLDTNPEKVCRYKPILVV
jgi:hypothetical protein